MAIGKSPRIEFVHVAMRDRIAAGHATVVRAGEFAIALYDVDGRVLAIDDPCIHCGSSLAAGTRDAAIVTCGRCGWRYDIVSGAVVGLPALRLERYPVRIEEHGVLVALHAAGDP
jgi:nitrite reductase/ring-hydroxylating ferredoxin subunit